MRGWRRGDDGEEVGRKLVIAGGDAAEVFEPAEGVLDQVATSVASVVVGDLLAVDPARDHRNGLGLSQGAA